MIDAQERAARHREQLAVAAAPAAKSPPARRRPCAPSARLGLGDALLERRHQLGRARRRWDRRRTAATCTGEAIAGEARRRRPGTTATCSASSPSVRRLRMRPPAEAGRRAPARARAASSAASWSSSCSMASTRRMAPSSVGRPGRLEPLLHAVEDQREALRQLLAIAVGEEAERGVVQRDQRAAVLRREAVLDVRWRPRTTSSAGR